MTGRDASAAAILIVEDEPDIATVLTDYLSTLAPVHWLDDGASAVDWVREHAPALVVLDLMLPGKDGFEICRELRAFSDVPILMLTARIEEIDRLLGLELGADDYVCKPFYPREVVARVKRLLQRAAARAAPPAASPLAIDPARFAATLDGRALDLTPVEFRLLSTLAGHPGHVLSRDRLMDSMYPDRRVVSDRTIDTHVRNLRSKLQSVRPDEDLIESVYGVGYRLDV
jgi:two-component system response regulator BaeR